MAAKQNFVIVAVLILMSTRHGHTHVVGPYDGGVDRRADNYEKDLEERLIETERLGISNFLTH